jgi:alkylhydroperoxidase family enzyme
LTDAQIAAIADPAQWAAHFAPAELLALELATRLVNDAHDLGPDLIARLKAHYGEEQLAELLLVAGQANLNNRVNEGAIQLFAAR